MNCIGYLGASLIGGVVLLGQGRDPRNREIEFSRCTAGAWRCFLHDPSYRGIVKPFYLCRCSEDPPIFDFPQPIPTATA